MQKFKRDDGTEVEVEYELESSGSPNFDFPGHICDGGGEAPNYIITAAYDELGNIVVLTDAECARMEAWLVENIPVEYDYQEDDVL